MVGGNGISERLALPRGPAARDASEGIGGLPDWAGVIVGEDSGKPDGDGGTEGVNGGAGGIKVPGAPDTAFPLVTWPGAF
ncbi:hypothetical protein [Thermogutta sp.]|uniref:hypothetical protein n=1 Tax=Thermogutta sp. TaxID=1962930 RepID=UPI003C7CA8AD